MIGKLSQLGLNNKEILLYFTILEYKKILPANLSYICKINRTTVYSTLKTLKKKNLIAEDIGEKTKYVIALPIENLHNIIEQKRIELQKQESTIEDLIKELSQKYESKKIYTPKIQYIEEDTLESFLYAQLDKWNKSLMKYDSIWWGFQDPNFVESFLDFIGYQWNHSPQKVSLRLFTNESDFEQKLLGKYQQRELKIGKYFGDIHSTLWILGDYIVTVFTQQKPFYLIETYNPLLAETMRTMFKNMWGKTE